ncbi:MAG: ATP-binding protein [Candidatus Peribacteraceae bacterium]|nr:ATP-binding protein [Candidatus Peribacteraceae bacterium]
MLKGSDTKEGNELGMFVAKGAVEAQGGSIRFESAENKGTTFFVKIPLGQKPTTPKEK